MSYYTNDSEIDRENGSVLHKAVVFFNILICVCYCFLAKDAVYSLWQTIDFKNLFSGFSLAIAVIDILTVIELLAWIGVLICILAHVPNLMIGRVFATIVFCVVITCVCDTSLNEWTMNTGSLIEYALAVGGLFLLVWMTFTNRIRTARQIWALPGILMCLSTYRSVTHFSAFIDQATESISSFFTMIVLPLSMIIFMFCFANWASRREEPVEEEKKKAPYTPVQTANLKPLDIPQSSEEAAKMTCPYCGGPRNLGDKICPRCGMEDKRDEKQE